MMRSRANHGVFEENVKGPALWHLMMEVKKTIRERA
jgi:hypothetical protein